jgi:iron only hydrogenase large subunit-like protein
MNKTFPVYTVETECQDCYKCLRHCPVKAIKVEHGRATVIPGACIACGRCVEVCPAHAKHIRDDLGRAKFLLERKARVYISLAPSYAAAFPGVPVEALIHALKKLGAAGVSETALGAERVNQAVAAQLKDTPARLHLSTACPVAVSYICKYMPEMADCLTPTLSPMLAHGKFLRETYGEEIGIIFIGPCIAKKCEADEYEQLIDVALTFDEFKRWLNEAELHPEVMRGKLNETFVPYPAHEGALYPMAGGMNETLRLSLKEQPVRLLSVAGLRNIRHALNGFADRPLEEPVFLELLACDGGCLGGPCVNREAVLPSELEIRRRTQLPSEPTHTKRMDLQMTVHQVADVPEPIDPQQIMAALARIGKYKPEDELNCGGCGYDSCQAFVRAMLAGCAEPSMCVSNLRKKAQRKANALLRCMPSGVVIADADLNVIECNENLAKIFGGDLLLGYRARPGLEGVHLGKVVPFPELFQRVLESGQDYLRDMMRIGDRLINLTVFTIDPHETVGGILLDVTSTELRREHIATRAREVIDKNLATVQEIAFKLGEHMADTEILLRSIAEDYAEEGPVHDGKPV